MALDYSPLLAIDPGGAFLRGRERAIARGEREEAQAERNLLRQMQMEQMAAQRENMLAQRQEREAHAEERRLGAARRQEEDAWLGKMADLFGQNGVQLTPETVQQGLAFALRSRNPAAIQMMQKTVEVMQARQQQIEEDARAEAELARITGRSTGAAPSVMRQPAAAMFAAPAAPPNLLAGTPYDIGVGAPAPVNALAVPAPAAPAGFTRDQVQQMLTSPSARIREQGKALAATLPKEEATPSDVLAMKALGFPLTTAGYAAFREAQRQERLLSPEEEAQRTRIALASRPPAQPRPEPAPRTQQVTMSDGTIGIMNMDTGQVTPASLGGAPVKGKPSAFAEKTTIQRNQLMTDLDRTIAELEDAAKPKGLIAQSTGSGAGRLVDIGAAFVGQATPGAIAASRLAPIADMVLKMVPRFEGPQSDKDTKSYKEAAGQLADTSLPTKIRQAAATEIVRLMRARKNQFVTQEMAAEGVAPAGAAPAAAPAAPRRREIAPGVFVTERP